MAVWDRVIEHDESSTVELPNVEEKTSPRNAVKVDDDKVMDEPLTVPPIETTDPQEEIVEIVDELTTETTVETKSPPT